MGSINKFKPKGPIMSELRNFASRPARPTSAAIKNKWGQINGGRVKTYVSIGRWPLLAVSCPWDN